MTGQKDCHRQSPNPTGTVLQTRAHAALFSFLSILATALPAFPISPFLLNFLIYHCLRHYQDLQGPSTCRAFWTDPKQSLRQDCGNTKGLAQDRREFVLQFSSGCHPQLLMKQLVNCCHSQPKILR